MIQLFCDLLLERIRIITHDKTCPNDLLGPVSTLIWCSERVEIDEFIPVKNQFYYKYGSTFVQEAQSNSNYMVNDEVIKKLSIRPPTAYLVQEYLKEIAKEYHVDWSPAFNILPDDPAHCLPPSGVKHLASSGVRVPPPPPETASESNGEANQATLLEEPPSYDSLYSKPEDPPNNLILSQSNHRGQTPSEMDAIAERLAALKGSRK